MGRLNFVCHPILKYLPPPLAAAELHRRRQLLGVAAQDAFGVDVKQAVRIGQPWAVQVPVTPAEQDVDGAETRAAADSGVPEVCGDSYGALSDGWCSRRS